MKIYGIDDNVLLSASITNSAQHEEEMMKSDFVRLSWKSNVHTAISVGSYIIPFADGLKYRLIEPYEPQQDSEDTFTYQPEFQHPKMWLTKVPFTYATKNVLGEDVVQQEWEYTGQTVTLLNYVVDFINTAFGFTSKAEKFALTIIGSVDTNISVSFSSTDVISALSAIASACSVNQCEWHLSWKHKALYFGQVSVNLEETIPTLKVGKNVGKASISDSSDGYYNVFYPQGSTRNMSTLAASGENVSTGIRLGLNKTKYPTGEIDTRTDKNEPKQTLALTFDDIFPHVDCYVYNVRKRTRYLLDDQNNKVVSSYNADGSVNEYKKYTVWYMRLAYPLTAKKNGEEPITTTTETLNGKEQTLYWYDYVVEDKQIIDGYTLCGSFKVNTNDGALASSLVAQPSLSDGFELTFHKTAQTIPANETTGDSGVDVLAGDFEIIFSNNNGTIIPTNESEGLIPRGSTTPSTKNNIVILYNIVMGDDEVEASQDELEAKIKEEIAYRHSDLNNYTFSAYPNVWAKSNPNLYIGQRVVFDDGNGYSYTTRILKLVTNLDYDIVQEITVGNSTIKGTVSQLKEDVQGLISGTISVGSGLSYEQVVNIIKNYARPRFLSKQYDDVAQGKITSVKAFQIGQSFVSGLLGTGGVFQKDADGKTYIEADRLYIRTKAYFDTLEIRRYEHSSGNRVASMAGAKIIRVDYLDASGNVISDASSASAFRCYFRGKDGDDTINNDFAIGDEARCHTVNATNGSMSQRSYWRLVTGVSSEPNANGEHYVDLSNQESETLNNIAYSGYMDGSGIPQAQDDLFQLGNVNDKTRCGAIIEFVAGGGTAPSYQIYQNVGYISDTSLAVADKRKIQYSTDGCNYVNLGYNQQRGRAYMNVYGDTYIGDRPDSEGNAKSFVKYDAEGRELTIKANIEAQSTIGGTDIKEYIEGNSHKLTSQELETLLGKSELITQIKNQADGAIETWYYKGEPSLTNAPASDWKTDNDKDTHIGDLYYNESTGYAYRFLKDSDGAYSWTLIQDTSIAAALKEAQSKRRIFVVQPTPPYEVGDLWVNANGTYTLADNTSHTLTNDILRCSTKRDSGNFSASDWQLASNYTDDTAVKTLDAQLKKVFGDDYLANADTIKDIIGGSTEVNGGLVLTNVIGMKNGNTVTAGMSGVIDTTLGNSGLSSIAAWYGGQMQDRQYYDDKQDGLHYVDKAAANMPSNPATSLFRMDGSGYIASGNISWDETGRVNVRNLYLGSTLITGTLDLALNAFNYTLKGDGSRTVTMISPQAPFDKLYIGEETDNGKVVTFGTLTSEIADNYTWWGQKVSGKSVSGDITGAGNIAASGNLTLGTADGQYIQVGGVRLVYVEKYHALKVVQSDGTTAANFYATGGVSALGISGNMTSGDAGGGATTLSALTDTIIGSDLEDGQVLYYDGTHWINKEIGDIATDGISSVTYTGSGNAVTAIEKNGSGLLVTKGTTFLTSHQSLDAYALKSAIPTKTSQLTNDSGFVTSSVVNGYATESWVNSLQIGVRNLIRNVSQITKDNPYTVTTSSIDWYTFYTDYGVIYSEHELQGGEKITLQVESDAIWSSTHQPKTKAVGLWIFWCDGIDNAKSSSGTAVTWNFLTPDTTGSTHFKKTITAPSKGSNYPNGMYMRIRLNCYSDGTNSYTFKFWDIKAELGDKATGWCPAVEELSLTSHTHSVIVNGTTYTIPKSGDTAVNLGTYLPLSGGTMTGQIYKDGVSSLWYAGRDHALIRQGHGNYSPILSAKTLRGSWELGAFTNDILHLSYITDTDYNAHNNAQTVDISFGADGVLNAPTLSEGGTTLANKYLGISANAVSATKLQTARTVTVGNTSKSFDGQSNVSWSLSEIGAAEASSVQLNGLVLNNSQSFSPNIDGDAYIHIQYKGRGWDFEFGNILIRYGKGNDYFEINLRVLGYNLILAEVGYFASQLLQGLCYYWSSGIIHVYIKTNTGNGSLSTWTNYTISSIEASAEAQTTNYYTQTVGLYYNNTAFARVTDNVASATQLATSRTIWGQSFDGTGNVDGLLSIHPTNTDWREGIRIHTYSGSALIALCGTDNTGDSGTSANTWVISNKDGNLRMGANNTVNTGASLALSNSGNVGVGTNAPAYKLDVNGTMRASGAAYFNSSVNVDGTIYMGNGVLLEAVEDDTYKGDAFRIRTDFAGSGDSNRLFISGSAQDTAAASYTDLVTVTAQNGYVGIGTSSPTCKLDVNGALAVNGYTTLKGGMDTRCIELNTNATSYGGDGGYIDFHFAGSDADYTSRIIESQSGVLNITSNVGIYGWLQVNSLLKGLDGIVSETYMQASTYVQIGDIRLVYDSTNNAIKVVKSDGSVANFYATGGITAEKTS